MTSESRGYEMDQALNLDFITVENLYKVRMLDSHFRFQFAKVSHRDFALTDPVPALLYSAYETGNIL